MILQTFENGETGLSVRTKINSNFNILSSVSTIVESNSADWSTSIDSEVRALSANWDSVYTTVESNSAAWNSVYTTVESNSASWDSLYTNVDIISADLDVLYDNVNTVFDDLDTLHTNLDVVSANLDSVYSSVLSNSANWDAAFASSGIDSEVRSLSAEWDSVYTHVQANSGRGISEDYIIVCSNETTDLSATASIHTFRVPYGMYLNSVRASVSEAPVGSSIIVDVLQTGTSIFSTKLSIDSSEETSTTALTPAVISNPTLMDDSKIVINVDQVGSSTAGKGLKLTFKGYRL